MPTPAPHTIAVDGEFVALPGHMRQFYVLNWHDSPDEVVRFKRRRRRRSPRHIVIHESAGGVDGFRTIRSLERRGYGVHLVLHPDGMLTCHGDLVRDRLVHANQCNSTSVGIEIINPYTPTRMAPPFGAHIPAEWWTWVPKGGPRRYVLPTSRQAECLTALVPWLCHVLPDVPLAFPTAYLGRGRRRILGWRLGRRPRSGIVAHRDFAKHADGRWPLEQLIQEYGGTA